MNRIPLQSSLLKSVGYDPASQTLEVEFSNGKVYQYQGFPSDAWMQFQTSDSKGSYFHKNIKGKFTTKKA